MKKLIIIGIVMLILLNISQIIIGQQENALPTISGPQIGKIGSEYTFIVTKTGWLKESNLEYYLGYEVEKRNNMVNEDIPDNNIDGLMKTDGWSRHKLIKATWNEPGTYCVCARVRELRNDDGVNHYRYTEFAEHIITIKEQPLHTTMQLDTSINENNYHAFVDQYISFTSTPTSGNEPFQFKWDFGDGSTSQNQNTNHIYTKPGIYQIILEVTDNYEHIDIEKRNITIERTDADLMDIHGGKSIRTTFQSYGKAIPWSMQIKGKRVIGKTIYTGNLPPNSKDAIKTGFLFGFGPIDITIILDVETHQYQAFLLGSKIINITNK